MMSSGDAQDGMYYLRDRNRVSGPFDVDTLRRFAQGKRLARHHQLSTLQAHPEQAIRYGLWWHGHTADLLQARGDGWTIETLLRRWEGRL